ncbi:regulator of G-protein signaling loco-like [Musca vetustissima]|uniref:regulator of G-protein signaling loco-like n=1 Tax=Musca vetustissima TaxID=27455 RepID=UPI002AB70159|nr:regulator of G-protein signaling loco-like [Musca vetustissima]
MLLHPFHPSIAYLNDSSNFESSFEVKYIPTNTRAKDIENPQQNGDFREIDREALLRFVQEFEALQFYDRSNKSTPKKSINSEENLHYNLPINDQIISGNCSASRSLRHSIELSSSLEIPILRNHKKNLWPSEELEEEHFDLPYYPHNFSETSHHSNSELFQNMGCKSLKSCESLDDDAAPEESIELMAHNLNSSSDSTSSIELQPPLLPSFKITPPRMSHSSASDLGRFLRCSFNVKRAKITPLQRSISVSTETQLSDISSKAKRNILEDRTNKNNGGRSSLSSRLFPSSGRTSPFRRVWEHSSLRSPRSDRYNLSPRKSCNPEQRCSSPMIATDDDVFLAGTVPVKPQLQLLPTARRASDKVTSSNNVQQQIKTSRVGSWAISFENLLDDPAGLATFAEFLKMEFSVENIYFWTACERYRNTESQAERQAQAKQIFAKHLASTCCEPVNLDSQTRNISPEALEQAEKELFSKAQKQIFHLMKFDSYQRFIRSDLYKNCQNAEEKNQPLPYGADNLDALLRTNFLQSASPKLKKSASNAEDRRRKILLPWHRKTRSKSRDRMDAESASSADDNAEAALTNSNALNTLIMRTAAAGKMTPSKSAETLRTLNSPTCHLCRVKFSDEATTIVQIKPHETVGQLVERVLEKRGLHYRLYEVILKSENKTIDLQASSQIIAGEDVEIEPSITFKLYLPDPKVISVKSKPKKQLHEIVSSILQKYNYDMNAVDVLRRDTMESMNLYQPVTNVDGQRLHVVLKETNTATTTTSISNNGAADYQNDNISLNYLKSKELANEFKARNAKNSTISSSENNLNALSSKERRGSNQLMDLGEFKSNESGSETSLNGRKTGSFNFRTRGKIPILIRQHSSEPQSTASELNKPIIAKLKAGAKLQVTERVAEKQDELLLSLKSRLDNQPIMSTSSSIPSILPSDYTRNNKENQQNDTALTLRQIRSNLSPVNKTPNPQSNQMICPPPLPMEKPIHLIRKQSITLKRNSLLSNGGDDAECEVSSNNSDTNETSSAACKGPPPLPPKPKVLPTKPSNWGANNSD